MMLTRGWVIAARGTLGVQSYGVAWSMSAAVVPTGPLDSWRDSGTLRPAMSHERAGKAVFVDRDGVLNRSTVRDGKPYAPRRLEEFRLLPGAAASLRALKSAGYAVVVVTNQPDIGNGLVAREIVEAMHARLRARAPVDAIEMCPHRQDEGCDCRKPRPGMLLSAARRLRLSLPDSIVVGDRAGDVAAGKAAGCRTVFVDRGYAETGTIEPDARARNLPEAVRLILAGRV